MDYTGTCIYTYTLMLSFEQLQFSLNKFFEARVSSRFKFSCESSVQLRARALAILPLPLHSGPLCINETVSPCFWAF